ncbi:MAG TPA: GDSL-type esterase/lipase family protein [Solirubrobacteraceae bacterium]
MASDPCRLGLVALGDSITNGGGNMALGVYPRSWAHWLALALELPYTGLAADGATAADVVAGQVPRLAGAYDVGGMYVGVNDVRSVGWDPERFARDYATALAALAERCARVAALTIPLDLGRPRAGAKVGDANALIRRLAAEHAATVVALDDLRGWRALLPDAVHPHAVGQLAIADRVARALGAEVLPSALGEPDEGLRAQARWARAWGRMWLRDVARRLKEGGAAALRS